MTTFSVIGIPISITIYMQITYIRFRQAAMHVGDFLFLRCVDSFLP